MKKIIRYEIRGQIERSCYFKVGKALLRVDFTGGMINSAGMTPAHYVTDNKFYQKAIEESGLFRNGEITIGNVEYVGNALDKVVPNTLSEKESVNVVTFPDVTNVQQARSVLMAEPYRLSLSDLQNKAVVKSKAEECGISFPNWL